MSEIKRATVVTVVLEPRPGTRDDVLELVREAFSRIRAAEPEALVLTAHTSDDSEQILLYELWSDEEVFEEFLTKPEMTAYLTELDARLISRHLTRWTPTSA